LFITVFYGVLDAASGRMTYCNAGHNSPFLFSTEKGSAHQELSRTGMPLGIVEEASWEQGVVTINPGDVLLAYTDGVTEAQNEGEEFYGEARLVSEIQSQISGSTQKIQEAVVKDLQGFVGEAPQFDDMTLMIVKKL
jgi:sigma-B regulation protein RsbU (phosphoserine phosphatase)